MYEYYTNENKNLKIFDKKICQRKKILKSQHII